MSSQPERKMVGFKFDVDKKGFEIKLDDGSTLFITADDADTLLRSLPMPSEELRARMLLNLVHEIRQKRILTIEEADEILTKTLKAEEDVMENLKRAPDKLEIAKCSVMVKSIIAKKTLLSEKRHLIRLLFIEEAKYKALLQKTELLRKSESEEQ